MENFLHYLENAWLIFLVVMFFNFMIFVHELGHFLAGKWRGAYIDRFQIWFGKPLWQKEIGGVKWGIGWLPAGGFVSLPQLEDMQAVEGEVENLPKNLKPLKPLDKVIIAAAGPLFSLLLAYAFAFVVWGVGKPVGEIPGTTIGFVPEGTPAAEAGLLPGDVVTAVDGRPVTKWVGNMEGVKELVAMSEHETIKLSVDRRAADGSTEHLTIESSYRLPETKWWQRGGLRQIGISPAAPTLIASVVPDSPAALAGLKPGEEITAVNGTPVHSPMAVVAASEKGTPLLLTLRAADGSERTSELTPVIPQNWQGLEGAVPVLGIAWDSREALRTEYPTPQAQVNQGFKFMGDTLVKVAAPGSSVGMEHLSGPVGIGNYLFQMLSAEHGWKLILWFAVILNVNLAVLNILPLPIVDGGHVVLGCLEMIFRRPVGGKILNGIQYGFLMILLAFFLFVTFKDVGDAVGGGQPKLPAPIFKA